MSAWEGVEWVGLVLAILGPAALAAVVSRRRWRERYLWPPRRPKSRPDR